MSSSMGHLLYYNFVRLSVALIILQDFLFVHSLSSLSTRSASGFLRHKKRSSPIAEKNVFIVSRRSFIAAFYVFLRLMPRADLLFSRRYRPRRFLPRRPAGICPPEVLWQGAFPPFAEYTALTAARPARGRTRSPQDTHTPCRLRLT